MLRILDFPSVSPVYFFKTLSRDRFESFLFWYILGTYIGLDPQDLYNVIAIILVLFDKPHTNTTFRPVLKHHFFKEQ